MIEPDAHHRVLIADDSDDVRQSVADYVDEIEGLELVATAENGEEAIEKASYYRPDLILMDIRMPRCDGLTATRHITTTMPRMTVLILTTHDDPEYLLKALNHGAAGYLLKDTDFDTFELAVSTVLRGESYFSAEHMKQTLTALAKQQAQGHDHQLPFPTDPSTTPLKDLTEREYEALVYMCQGCTNAEIAENMWVTLHTVKGYTERIFAKLDVGNRGQAQRKAIEYGILTRPRSPA